MAIVKIEEIEKKISASADLPLRQKEELLKLMRELKAELETLPSDKQEHAQSIAGFAQLSTHEATRADRQNELFNLSIRGLHSSVGDFEASHPELVKIVNRISIMLSSIGI